MAESDLTLLKVNVNETSPLVQNADDEDDLCVVLSSSQRCNVSSSTTGSQSLSYD